MLLNYNTAIVGKKVVLVPYRPEHVANYHEWMKDPCLLDATGSEPLSLEEEMEMQASWRMDNDKCTFIVLAKEKCQFEGDERDFVTRNISAMVGDCNLFLSSEDDDEDSTTPSHYQQAELDIMIAEQEFRGRGLGREASLLMMLYGTKELNLQRFFSKINEDNTASRFLFEHKLGFAECNYASCFKQYEYERREDTPDDMIASLTKMMGFDELETIDCPLNEMEKNGDQQ